MTRDRDPVDEPHLSRAEIQRRLIERDEGSFPSGGSFRKPWEHRAYPNGARLGPMDLADRVLVEDLVENLHRAETNGSIKVAAILGLLLLLAVWNAPWPRVWSLSLVAVVLALSVGQMLREHRHSHARLGLDDRGRERLPGAESPREPHGG